MKYGKWWWIICGIILLWLSPLFWGMASSRYKQHQQELYQKRVEAWNERVTEHLRPKYSEAERLKLKAEFDQAMKEAADRWAATEVRIMLDMKKITEMAGKGVFVPKVGYDRTLYEDWDRYYRQTDYFNNRPNLSGTYISIPLTGPNVGDVQINAISGPN